MAYGKLTLKRKPEKDEEFGPQERRVFDCISKACKNRVGSSATREEVLGIIEAEHKKKAMTEKMTAPRLLSYYQKYLAQRGLIALEKVPTAKQQEAEEKKGKKKAA